jgi:3-hydroxybutyryl-CoA dehydrogenase
MTWTLAADDTVAVLGAGTMGAGIAHVAAAAGHRVLLYDAAEGAVTTALAELEERLARSVGRGRISDAAAADLLGRITAVDTTDAFAPARLVVEAIIERLDVKQAVLDEIARVVAHDAVIATNTSSLSVTAIAGGIAHPERVVGMHFFNPAPVMPLVEIVSGSQTEEAIADGLFAAAVAWGKQPVRCASTPGFIVNRVARPFYGEALRLLQEGVASPATIDAVVCGAGGFRMGPFALMDLVGLDVNLAVSTSVYEQTSHDPRFAPNVLQQAMVDAGRLGRKSGAGWYEYGDGVDVAAAPTMTADAAPSRIDAHGDLGWAEGLVDRLRCHGIHVDHSDGRGPGHLIFDDIAVFPGDGRSATEIAAGRGVTGGDVAVFDLVRDWAEASRIAFAVADQASGSVGPSVAGLLAGAGLEPSLVDDGPGLVLMRIVAQLASVAADAVHQGVASAADVDTAMRLGTNYPSGPLEWADALGADCVVAVLDRLRAAYGEERYRASIALRRAAITGRSSRPATT